MGDTDVRDAVLEVRLAVVVVAEVDLLSEELAKKGPDSQPLLTHGLAAYE